MTDTFTTPDETESPAPKASDAHTSLAGSIGAQALGGFLDNPTMRLIRSAREAHAGGEDQAVGQYGEADVYSGVPLETQQSVIDSQKASIPDISQSDAKALLKQESLSESDVPLGDAPSHKLPVLQMRIDAAHAKRDRDAAIERGPSGLFPGALGLVTSLGVGMLDPINDAAFMIPVIGEARWGKILASAGDSIAARSALQAGRGAAQGAVGTTALQPFDWWLHTQDGQDYTMAQAMENIAMGAGMGAAFHALPATYRDIRDRYKRNLPLEGSPTDNAIRDAFRSQPDEQLNRALGLKGNYELWREGKLPASAGPEALRRASPAPSQAPAATTAPSAEEVPGITPEAPTTSPAEPAPVSPAPYAQPQIDAATLPLNHGALDRKKQLLSTTPEQAKQFHDIAAELQNTDWTNRVQARPQLVPSEVAFLRAQGFEVGDDGLMSTLTRGKIAERAEFHRKNPTVDQAATLPLHPGEVIADLPPAAREDALHAAMAGVIHGEPVQAAEMLNIAADHDPRIAETMDPFNRAGEAARNAPDAEIERQVPIMAREAVFRDVYGKLVAAGLSPEEAHHNAGVAAARYATRADRLGTGATAMDLYAGEGIDVRTGEPSGEAGRVLNQRRPPGPDLFAEREAQGQASLPQTERISDAELAQRRANEALKPKVAQKPADEGLFGDEKDQKSFFQSRPTAPTFYSAVGRTVDNFKQDKASPEQWAASLKNMPGVKPEEMKYLGLEDWLHEQKGPVTKAQIQDYIRANQIEVKEVAKGPGGPKPTIAQSDAVLDWADRSNPADLEQVQMAIGDLEEGRANGRDTAAYLEGLGVPDELLNPFRNYAGGEGGPKYSSYTLPGGENYRELLLTLPEKPKFDTTVPDRQAEIDHVPAWQELNLKIDAARQRMRAAGLTENATHAGEVIILQRLEAEREALHERMIRETWDRLPASKKGEDFKGAHWEEPNVLAHIRFDDRISDGKKTLHVAEVQSDWHQKGRDKGYKNPQAEASEEEIMRLVKADSEARMAVSSATEKAWKEATGGKAENLRQWTDTGIDRHELRRAQEYVNDSKERAAAYDKSIETARALNEALERGKSGVPDAPFKTTWPELSMKRMIRYAAENGYDRISWDTGATNAERYDLSKQISRVTLEDNSSGGIGRPEMDGPFSGGMLHAYDHSGREVLSKYVYDPKEIPDLIGKEAADKIMSVEPKEARSAGFGVRQRKLEGLDLKVGGEGMHGFYDKILPATVNKLVKKFGAKVEEGEVPTGDPRNVTGWETTGNIASSPAAKVHAVDITPELRNAAIEQGFPLFQGGENPRGRITLSDNRAIIDLFHTRDASTFMHESGHLWLDELMRDASHPEASDQLKSDRDTVLKWLGVKDASEIGTPEHEKWADGFEQYLRSGEAPSSALKAAFDAFKRWLTEIYQALSRSGQQIPPEIKGVMDRLLATDREIQDYADERNAKTIAKTESLRGRAAADPQSWSLFEYLASKGGLKPDPELEAIFGGKRGPMIGGFGPLLRKAGMPLDEALRSAKDGHYLFDNADITGGEASLTPRDLLDRIDEESRGRKIYRLDRAQHDRAISLEEEEGHIVSALHDELEATTGQKGIEIDADLERRVVDIIQNEGEYDVLAAYERAIMEDEERYNAVNDARAGDPELGHIEGWDVPADQRPASPDGADLAGQGRPAGRPEPGQGGNPGNGARAAGPGDRAPQPAKLKSTPAQAAADPRWRELASVKPDYDDPETLAESEAAEKLPEPDSTLSPIKSLSALEKAAADAEEVWRKLEPTLTEEERALVNDVMDKLKLDAETRAQVIQQGAACLAGAIG